MANYSGDSYERTVLDPEIDTIDTYHDVPSANTADNNQMRDVIGNKTDTVGDSIYAILLQVICASGRVLEKSAASLPQSGQSALFTVNGTVQIIEIRGEVTTQIENQANNTKLVANPTVGADVDLCGALDIANDAVGTMYSITGTLANNMIATTSGAFESQGNPVTVADGTIDLSCAASNTGEIKWTIFYRAVANGASIVPT